jgi:hypothetical protein
MIGVAVVDGKKRPEAVNAAQDGTTELGPSTA